MVKDKKRACTHVNISTHQDNKHDQGCTGWIGGGGGAQYNTPNKGHVNQAHSRISTVLFV